MASGKIAVARNLGWWRVGIGDDSLYSRTGLPCQTFGHVMCRLTEGNGQNARVRLQVIKVVANPKDPAVIADVALKRLLDAGLRQPPEKDLLRNSAHVLVEHLHAQPPRREK